MVYACFVSGCNRLSYKDKHASFYRIPSIISLKNKLYSTFGCELEQQKVIKLSQKRQEAWIKVLNRGILSDSEVRNARVCDKHFISGRYVKLVIGYVFYLMYF